jgi:hypothetical protein
MDTLSPQETAIVTRARDLNLLNDRPPGYLSPGLCTALSLVLAIPTLGFSLLFVPILWVAQYDHTARRIEALRRRVESFAPQAAVSPGSEAA